MKKFCKDLREHSTGIINYEKKKMIALTTEEKIHYNKQKVCYCIVLENIEVQLIIFVI